MHTTMPEKSQTLRAKSEGAQQATRRISRASRNRQTTTTTPSSSSSSPSSPESVITYLGRTYTMKDLFPDLVAASLTDANEQGNEDNEGDRDHHHQQEEAPTRRIIVPAHMMRRGISPKREVLAVVAMPGPIRRPRGVARTKSAGPGSLSQKMLVKPTRKMPTRSLSAGGRAQMVASVEERQQASKPGLLRSTTLNAMKNLFGDNKDQTDDDLHKFGIHSNTVRTLNYTQVDVANICDDHREFERLKATLKKQGAITNEVLKQGLHFYVQAKKDREANGGTRSASAGRRRRARRTRSQEENETERPVIIRRSGTTGDIM